jgi:hypothetical protein
MAKKKKEKELHCPMCKAYCYNGFVYMLHHTIGCKAAKRY